MLSYNKEFQVWFLQQRLPYQFFHFDGIKSVKKKSLNLLAVLKYASKFYFMQQIIQI